MHSREEREFIEFALKADKYVAVMSAVFEGGTNSIS